MAKTDIQRDIFARIEDDFTYHPPTAEQRVRYTDIRERGKALARWIAEKTPQSREQSLALTKLEEAIMWANAAIARNEPDDAEHVRS